MKAVITGAGGQVGRALARAAPAGWSATALTRAELDIGDADAVRTAVDALRPDLILNAAAYTAVDRAEGEPEAAFRVNGAGAGHVAEAAARIGARIVHVSTDYVFDGSSTVPWRPDDAPNPLNVYGASKLAGERAVTAAGGDSLIVRTAWVYSAEGTNFLTTMLRLMKAGGEVRVVDDQVGTPTSADSLAAALWALAQTDATGVLHFTDGGRASWFEFARAIAEEGGRLGLVPEGVRVIPISSAERPTAARRPVFSVLRCADASGLLIAAPAQWHDVLHAMMIGVAPSKYVAS